MRESGDLPGATTAFEALLKEYPRWTELRKELTRCYEHPDVGRYADAGKQWKLIEREELMAEAAAVQETGERDDVAFEVLRRYVNLLGLQRKQALAQELLRDAEWLQSAEKWFQDKAGAPADAPVRPPMSRPMALIVRIAISRLSG